jgi:hypothetical protein
MNFALGSDDFDFILLAVVSSTRLIHERLFSWIESELDSRMAFLILFLVTLCERFRMSFAEMVVSNEPISTMVSIAGDLPSRFDELQLQLLSLSSSSYTSFCFNCWVKVFFVDCVDLKLFGFMVRAAFIHLV